MKERNINYFDMTVEECKSVLDTIAGLVVVDRKGVIKYFSPDLFDELEEFYNMKFPQNLAGQSIYEIHPTSKISNAFSGDGTESEYFYFSNGIVNVACIRPIFNGKTIIGAVDYDLFTDTEQLKNFIERLGKINYPSYIGKGFSEFSSSKLGTRVSKYSANDIIGENEKIVKIRQKIYSMAESNSTVLIMGESGTGKELVAQAVHGASMRCRYPIVDVNCASIPDNLFESEFFGYEEGTFTGASKGGKRGKFQMADKGTIFLDEIDQLPYHMQPKLLRVLQEKEVTTLGGRKIKIDVRIIAATNKDLKKLVEEGKFREDLYYRLNVINIEVPPLRERKEDITALVYARIEQLNVLMNKSVESISDKALDILKKYEWPGNVRELFNVIERAMNECNSNVLEKEYFEELDKTVFKDYHSETLSKSKSGLLQEILCNTEKDVIEKGLKKFNYNITATAEYLGISRTALHYKLKKYNLIFKKF